jgi:hypothetical protein
MRRKIKKNWRRPFPWFEFIPIIFKKDKSFSIVKDFEFTPSTMYHFDDADQFDVNKLFGFSIGMHHTNSFRFGWRPSKDLLKMEIVGYEYHNKVRVPTIPLYEIEIGKTYRFKMDYLSDKQQVKYTILDNLDIIFAIHKSNVDIKKCWGYRLGLYFGGNKKAPHDMIFFQTNF